MDYINLNGQTVPADDAHLAPSDAGLLHGAGLFETMRARNGRIFSLAKHLRRLATSAADLRIPLALTETQLFEMVHDLLDANDLLQAEARVRLTLTRGDLAATTDTAPEPPITLLLTATPLTPYPPALYDAGMPVIISRFKQNPENPLCGHKTTSYFDRLIALREAKERAAGEALWFTPRNETLAEGSISNVFILDKEDVLVTPPLTVKQFHPDGSSRETRLCLPGVTREVVLELATTLNMLPHQRAITIDDLLAAKEVFLTNAIMGVMPVSMIEKHQVGTGKPGNVTRQLLEAWKARYAEECP